MPDRDDIVQLVDDTGHSPAATGRAWKVAIIDDDPAVHEGTRFALSDYALHGQGIEIISAYSAAEGRALLREHPDLAVILLDVIMETDSAGLDLVEFIRHELKNETVRIILRTGQPGQAPERRVIVDYDINDYKAKTELTADKLFTTLTAALRSYGQLQRMIETRRGLEIIIEAASTLFDFRSMQRLAEGVLTQMASLLNADCAGVLVLRDERHPQASFAVLAGSGCYSRFAGAGEVPTLDPHLLALIGGAFERRCHDFCDERSVIYIQTGSGREVVVLLESPKCLSETDRKLVEVFCSRLSIAFDNVLLYQQLQDANARLEERVTQRTAELTAANDRLATQGRRLREANRFKGEILGTVAHDLKNPLGVIMGRAEMLTDLLGLQPPALDGARAQIDHIRDSAKRLTGMVDALISDAMSDALDISIRSQTIDLVALVDRVVEANRPLAERKDQVVEVRKPEALVATGDPDRLQEAVDNLVSNAVKYGPVGSAITVEVKARGDRNAITVHDEGPGLSPEDIARLFGRFQRLSAKPTAGESSTGLGLSIAKRIVELHGGSIETESRGPGQGATFTILLPAEARPPAGARP
jgi:signal transduction histidine kinase/DNA-binding NarL/FixJ family response regulator